MQDNASRHTAKEVLGFFEELRVVMMKWPAFSPDLDPIEEVWNWMKDYIERKYGDQHFPLSKLRRVV